jgi:hypothetical protein
MAGVLTLVILSRPWQVRLLFLQVKHKTEETCDKRISVCGVDAAGIPVRLEGRHCDFGL